MPSLNQSTSLAIHNWLLHSVSKASDRQGSSQGCNRDTNDTKVLNLAGSTQQQPTAKDFPGLKRDPSEDDISRTFSMARQEPSSRRSPWKSGLDDENLPQRLGLYAPFRSFGRQSNDMNVDQHSIPASARKRKRNSPSASSDVEPAIFRTHTQLKTKGGVHRSMTSSSIDIAELKESVSDTDNGYSDLSTHSNGTSENMYRRKPRRKTRADRYDLKQGMSVENPRKRFKKYHSWERDEKRRDEKRRDEKRRDEKRRDEKRRDEKRRDEKRRDEQRRDEKRRDEKRRDEKRRDEKRRDEKRRDEKRRDEKRRDEKRRDGKRRKKSGSAMMHEFLAENIAPKRLTLESLSNFGLFNKGRASSPVKRKGLPDLSFSELSFLKSKRRKPNDSIKGKIEKSRLKSDNDWHAGAHILRYFASRKSVDRSICPSGPETSKLSRRATLELGHPSRGHLYRDVTPADFFNESEKPCLGFGSSRGDLTSPARNIEQKTNSQSPKPLCTRTASLVSWSVSGVPSHHDSIDRDMKNSSGDVPNVRTNIKTNHQASLAGQKPYDSVLPRRKVTHSSDKVSKLDEQQEELMAGNALSETMTTHHVGALEPQVNGKEKSRIVKKPAFIGQEDLPNQEPQAQFDAASENCPKDCKSTNHSPHGSVRSKATNTMCLSEKPDNIHDGNSTLPSQGNHNTQVPTIECAYENSEALHNDFFDPNLIHRALSFELQTDQLKEQLNSGLIDQSRRIPQYAYTSDHYGGLDRLSTGLSRHEFSITNASNNHENPAQRCFQMRNHGGVDEHGYHQQGNGCSNYTDRRAGLKNLEACTVAHNPGKFTSYELGTIGDHRSYSFYGLNDSTQFSGELSNSYDERKTESAIDEMREPPSRYTTMNETILDADVRDDEPLLQEYMDAGYYSVLEGSHEDFPENLLDPEIDPAGLPQDKNRNNVRLLRGEYCYDSSIPWYDIRSGAVNNVDIRQMAAMLQPNDELVIPGFWKPQKFY